MGFDKDKIYSILKGAVLAMLGAAVPALLAYLGTVDWGAVGGPLVGAAVAILLNVARKYAQPGDQPAPAPVPVPAPETKGATKPKDPFAG